jgi:hypothetical protein
MTIASTSWRRASMSREPMRKLFPCPEAAKTPMF